MMSDVIKNQQILTNDDFQQDWQQILANSVDSDVFYHANAIADYVNGKSLACPMPLLKLKMALKNVQIGEQVYITATDPNSQQDIGAFCRHQGYDYFVTPLDTIFHLLITKNC